LVITNLDETKVILTGQVRERRIVLRPSVEHSRPLAKGSPNPDPGQREATLIPDQT
jgi:hypothetical protein